MARGTKKRPAGRPRFEFDMGLVERLAQISCTDGEIAAACGCSVDTLARRRADEPGFAETIERAREAGKSSLRRAQWKAALSGDRTMLIWLGKQHLGQRDRQDLEVTLTPDQVSEMSDEQLSGILSGQTVGGAKPVN